MQIELFKGLKKQEKERKCYISYIFSLRGRGELSGVGVGGEGRVVSNVLS